MLNFGLIYNAWKITATFLTMVFSLFVEYCYASVTSYPRKVRYQQNEKNFKWMVCRKTHTQDKFESWNYVK